MWQSNAQMFSTNEEKCKCNQSIVECCLQVDPLHLRLGIPFKNSLTHNTVRATTQ